MEHEIKFIALPRESDLREALRRQGKDEFTERDPSVIQRYRIQQWRIYLAQRRAAMIAVEVLRPNEFREIKRKRDDRVRQANEQMQDECLSVFSETCTKGL